MSGRTDTRTDTERLEWMVRKIVTTAGSSHNFGPTTYGCYSEPYDRQLSQGHATFRDAIDAAMDAEERG